MQNLINRLVFLGQGVLGGNRVVVQILLEGMQ